MAVGCPAALVACGYIPCSRVHRWTSVPSPVCVSARLALLHYVRGETSSGPGPSPASHCAGPHWPLAAAVTCVPSAVTLLCSPKAESCHRSSLWLLPRDYTAGVGSGAPARADTAPHTRTPRRGEAGCRYLSVSTLLSFSLSCQKKEKKKLATSRGFVL